VTATQEVLALAAEACRMTSAASPSRCDMNPKDSASSIPAAPLMTRVEAATAPHRRGGEAEPPSELMLEIMKAHRNWALRFCPWTLEEWD